MALKKSQGYFQGIFKDIFDIFKGFHDENWQTNQQFCWNRCLWETMFQAFCTQNATKIMQCSTSRTFFKDFVKNSRVFHKIQVYFQSWNFQNEIQEFFNDSRVRGNPDKHYFMLIYCMGRMEITQCFFIFSPMFVENGISSFALVFITSHVHIL